jgi:putative redox protein
VDLTINWKGRLAFEGEADSGFVQQLDATETVGGENSAARPMEFIALGMAGCTAMDVLSILQKKQQAVTGFQVRLHADRAREHPRVFTKAVVEYIVTGSMINEAAVLRAIELSVEKYCPALAMLSKAFPFEFYYKIIDDSSNLVKVGTYPAKLSAS